MLTKLNHELFASGARSRDYSIKIWNWKSGNCAATLLGHSDSVRSLVVINN